MNLILAGPGCNNNYSSRSEDTVTFEAQLKELCQEKYPENAGWNLFPARMDFLGSVDLKDSRNVVMRDESKENHPCLVPVVQLPRLDHAGCRRKLSDVKRRKAESGGESSSSDDEIKEICSNGVTKVRAASRPPDKMAGISTSFVVCQRRRSKGALPRFQSGQRPSINFDKMQQVS